MTQFLFANDAKSTLAVGISATDVSIQLSVGTGALFPAPGAGQRFTLTLADLSTGTIKEIVYCTARAGDILTVVRAQEGTVANAYIAGSFANLFITAAVATAFAQGVITPPAGGTTAARPAPPTLYQSYIDTTLGLPIFCTQVSPPIWVSASGVAV